VRDRDAWLLPGVNSVQDITQEWAVETQEDPLGVDSAALAGDDLDIWLPLAPPVDGVVEQGDVGVLVGCQVGGLLHPSKRSRLISSK